jgi:hypothetical protein
MNSRSLILTSLLILIAALPLALRAEEDTYTSSLPIILSPPGVYQVDDEISLQTAVQAANNTGQMPRIELIADIQLTEPLPQLHNPGAGIAILDGRDHILDGNRLGTILSIGPGTAIIVENLTITNGSGTSGPEIDCGGAIYSEGLLTLRRTRLHDNWGRLGGAICIITPQPNTAHLTIQDSTLDHNTAYTSGGAIYAYAENGPVRIAIDDALIQANKAQNYGGGIATFAWTGAILTHDIQDTTLSDNHVQRHTGGAISAVTNDGTIDTTITRCTITANSAVNTGGFYQEGSSTHGGKATGTIKNSTFSGNTAHTIGGAISNIDFKYSINETTPHTPNKLREARDKPRAVIGGADLAIYFSTITGNRAERGSGVYNEDHLYVFGTIIAGNEEPGGDCWNPLQSGGYNLGSDGSCFFDRPPTDLQYGNADLQPLALNPPGSTATHALGPDSDALDRIPTGSSGCDPSGNTDQRGVPRPQPAGGLCDIGAYENNP